MANDPAFLDCENRVVTSSQTNNKTKRIIGKEQYLVKYLVCEDIQQSVI